MPQSFGYCYEESFDANEIVGVCHTVTLSQDERAEDGRLLCILPEELLSNFSWLDPTREESHRSQEIPAAEEDWPEDCPNSPKVAPRKRRNPEKRARAYEPASGEQLYRPQSHLQGMLLINTGGSFAYVHDDKARFSEGVQGIWSLEPGCRVRLMPQSFGYCYEESFDANEIVGVCHTVTLSQDERAEDGRLLCKFPEELLSNFSWLDPTCEESLRSTEIPAAEGDCPEDCPNSPKVAPRKRRNPEKRARAYEPVSGEQLYRPQSHLQGMLLINAGGSFAYVHDDKARFSEGVQGVWNLEPSGRVLLIPKSFGYCYEESFEANEIIDICHSVLLCQDQCVEDGKLLCSLPEELVGRFSWLDPTHEEPSQT